VTPHDDAAIVVHFESATPPYQQIVEQIRALIERGAIAPGDPLPTVRQLARDLNVAPNTIARAYGTLQSEGWLAGEERRGTRVAERVPSANPRARAAALQEGVAGFVTALRARGFTSQEIATEFCRFAEDLQSSPSPAAAPREQRGTKRLSPSGSS